MTEVCLQCGKKLSETRMRNNELLCKPCASEKWRDEYIEKMRQEITDIRQIVINGENKEAADRLEFFLIGMHGLR